MSQRVIRALFTDATVRVYQAYSPHIARPALDAGRFVPPFKMERMTWIKPSFNWMMYRCGYGQKAGQEVVLGIDITRAGFEWALAHASLSHYVADVHASREAWKAEVKDRPVRVQWDPERTWNLGEIDGVRSIQIGLSGEAVERYVHAWIVGIEDVTPLAKRAGDAAAADAPQPAGLPCDDEAVYPLPAAYPAIRLAQPQ
jgi:hypothetical protein